MGAVVLMTGTFRLAEVVSVQGGVPWKWYAFANPVTLALFVTYLATFVGKPLLAQEGATGFWSFWGSLRGHLMSGLGVLLYLGAWQVPGMGPGEAHRSALLCAVGSLVLVAKVALLRGFAEVVSHGMRREEFAPLLAQAFRFRVGLSLVALGLLLVVAAWVEWGPGPEVARLFGLGTFGLVLAAVVHIVSRIRFHLRETSTRLAVNPFL